MCIYSPMPHTLSYCALIGKCALIRSNTVITIKSIKKSSFKSRNYIQKEKHGTYLAVSAIEASSVIW